MAQAQLSKEHLPTDLYCAAECRALDKHAIQDLGIPGFSLMQKAAQFTFDTAIEHWPNSKSLTAVAGKGNNAGDAYLVAKLAQQAGLQAQVLSLGNPEELSGDAKSAYITAKSAGVLVQAYEPSIHITADIIVDGLLGTGLQGEVRDAYASAIHSINQSSGYCIAVDIPSGLCADTGKILGSAVKADVTATFIGCKQGLLTGDGPDCTGDIAFSDLDLPQAAYTAFNSTVKRVSTAELLQHFPRRPRTSHKGSNGHVLLIGGDHGMCGAIMLAAEGALRCGAGLVSVATRAEHANFITQRCPEVMAHGVDSPEQLQPLLDRASAIGLGPGLGKSAWGEQLAETAIRSDLPKIIDADGLNYLARCWPILNNKSSESNEHQNSRPQSWVLTPHPGEAARLLGQVSDHANTQTIHADRFAAVKALQKAYGGTILLKGAGSLIYGGAIEAGNEECHSKSEQSVDNDNCYVIAAGNPGMGTGGMGDVLSGVISSLLAQGFAPTLATRLGALLHSLAADRAAQEQGERGLVASDLMPYLRQIINQQ